MTSKFTDLVSPEIAEVAPVRAELKKPSHALLKTIPPSAGSEELQFIEPKFGTEEDVLLIDEEILAEGALEWENQVVGFFLDKKLPFMVVKETVHKKWKLKGDLDIALDGDMYYFRFTSEEDKEKVLDEGSFHMGGKLFVIRPWSRDVEDNRGPSKKFNKPFQASKSVWQKVQGKKKTDYGRQNPVATLTAAPIPTNNKFGSLLEEGEIEVVPDTQETATKNILGVEKIDNPTAESKGKLIASDNQIDVSTSSSDESSSDNGCSNEGSDTELEEGIQKEMDEPDITKYILTPEELAKQSHYNTRNKHKKKFKTPEERSTRTRGGRKRSTAVPWVLLGDFNTCKSTNEKQGGLSLRPSDIKDFNDCLIEASLNELTATGAFFTWSNRSEDHRRTLTRIDRALERIQSEIQVRPLDLNLATLEMDAIKAYLEIAKAELSSLRQKSRINKAQFSDQNSAFFHKIVQGKRARNRILRLTDSNGQVLTDETDIENEILTYFQDLMGKSPPDSYLRGLDLTCEGLNGQ
ncbi:hypothetical protein FRX31_002080 [Thalictrum thalictroides]|uniref:DUF4283 domain-containing protein n=1 Tax=Thalictrum thalictroides TaxID=46969 RepID=A0A7J6XFM8_THATH|nr:hypothetical protein FRX31_002080 [Thalictrum thalictroides]